MSDTYAMTEDHKTALAAGREQSRIVGAYLEALDTYKPKRGRQPSPERMATRLEEIAERIESDDTTWLKRLELISERDTLADEIERLSTKDDFSDLERQFVGVAALFAERKGISYRAFREVGVPVAVLKEAGVSS